MTYPRAMKLTAGQRDVLSAAARQEGTRKGRPGSLWRNFDQLERRGLIVCHGFGLYHITDIGRAALAKATASLKSPY